MPPPSITLCCRLLCACHCAYYIEPISGTYQPPAGHDPYGQTVGWLATPKAISGDTDRIDACLVGTNPDGVIVAFRGTLPPSFESVPSVLNWLQDLMAEPETRPNVPGKVHTGFYDATSSIIAAIAAEVRRLDPDGSKRVFVTGHSLGGAMASLGAWILHAAPYRIAVQQVVTFASPKPGDAAFKSAYEAVFTNQIRYENYDDVVPLVPPADDLIRVAAHIPLIGDLFRQAENWDYQPVGALRYIEGAEDGYAVIADHPLLMDERLLEIAAELAKDVIDKSFASLGNAHDSACGYGYMSGTCPAAVCAGVPVG
jgi:hypothetical protein